MSGQKKEASAKQAKNKQKKDMDEAIAGETGPAEREASVLRLHSSKNAGVLFYI